MKLEKAGKQILLNGTKVSRRTLEQIGRNYFTAESWERLLRDLDRFGRVHAAIVFTNDEQLLERANKKIALLEKSLAKVMIQNLYLKKGKQWNC